MGLYLCVFRSAGRDDDVEGVDVGSYADFHKFRAAVARHLEDGAWGSRFPVLMSHSDSDGQWTTDEAADLLGELEQIESGFAQLPSAPYPAGSWQHALARRDGLQPRSLAASFIDIDGEPLLARLRQVALAAVEHETAIWFQ